MKPKEEGDLHAKAFYASVHDNDQCGSNGLPLTPNSIRIVGRFQILTTLNHQNLCSYVELKRGKHEQVMVVTEGHPDNLDKELTSLTSFKVTEIAKLTKQILLALEYLHNNKITHRNLSLGNVQLDVKHNVKLADYGLYYMTEYGATVSFPIGDPVTMAPEVFLLDSGLLVEDSGSRRRTMSSSEETDLLNPCNPSNVDSWSLGVILLQIIAGEKLWADNSIDEVIEFLVQLLQSEDLNYSAFDKLSREFSIEAQQVIKLYNAELVDLITQCLYVDPSRRPTASELLKHKCLQSVDASAPYSITTYKPMKFNTELRCADLTLKQIEQEATTPEDYFHLRERTYQEIFYLWKLAGGDLGSALRKHGIIKDTPPIINTCKYVSEHGDVYGVPHDIGTMYLDRYVTLDLAQLCERLSEVDIDDYYPLIEGVREVKQMVRDSAELPLIIRERDVEYQFHRIVLYDRLLKGYPYTKQILLKEARTDIPPLVRASVWAAILDVQGNIYEMYDSIDKVTPHSIDRQIEVDIPRCHQYNELMSSPEAHKKLKRVLKAWVASHPQYVYWQGLDSLSAPFLYLNFNDEALVYASLSKFISKYLYNFFLQDNSAVIQEYLAVFSQLIAFHEPELSNHLEDIGFLPDLYAIPWFLTMYAHVFPLHKLFHLWDTLLLGASVFPICIGVAILQQLKARLLDYGFNECILLFSDLPEINIEQVVKDSVKVFRTTPKSATVRLHAPPSKQSQADSNKSMYEKSLTAEALPLAELKSQRCCRISAEEMLSLLSPSSDWNQSKPKIVIIDIRTPDEYHRGTIQGSMNSPAQKAFNPDGSLMSNQLKEYLDSYRYQVKVVVDSNNTQAGKFAAKLVELGYTKVCYLHKGMSILSGSSLLVVPSHSL